jgi:hypothetical protein
MALHREIISVASSGSGTVTNTEIDANGGRITVNETHDFIDIRTTSPSAPYPKNSWTLIKGKSFQNLTVGSGSYGLTGEDLPGVVAVRVYPGGDSVAVKYRIEFRNMRNPGGKITKIDLKSSGRSAAAGDSEITISNKGRQTDTLQVSGSERLPRTRTVIEVDLR